MRKSLRGMSHNRNNNARSHSNPANTFKLCKFDSYPGGCHKEGCAFQHNNRGQYGGGGGGGGGGGNRFNVQRPQQQQQQQHPQRNSSGKPCFHEPCGNRNCQFAHSKPRSWEQAPVLNPYQPQPAFQATHHSAFPASGMALGGGGLCTYETKYPKGCTNPGCKMQHRAGRPGKGFFKADSGGDDAGMEGAGGRVYCTHELKGNGCTRRNCPFQHRGGGGGGNGLYQPPLPHPGSHPPPQQQYTLPPFQHPSVPMHHQQSTLMHQQQQQSALLHQQQQQQQALLAAGAQAAAQAAAAPCVLPASAAPPAPLNLELAEPRVAHDAANPEHSSFDPPSSAGREQRHYMQW